MNRLQSLLDRITFLVIALLVAGTPLVISPPTYDSFVLPKFLWIKIWVAALGGLTVARLLAGREIRLRFHPLLVLMILYLGANFLSLRRAQSKPLAWDDLRVMLYLFAFALIFQDYFHQRSARLWKLGWLLTASALATGLWVVRQDSLAMTNPASLQIVSKLEDWRGFLAAGFGNTSHIGDFLALVWPLMALQYFYARGKVWEVFSLLALWISFAGMIVSFSVTSNFSALLVGIVIIIYLIRRESTRLWRRRALRLSVLVIGFVLISAFYSLDVPGNPHRPGIFKQALSSERLAFGWPSRLSIWIYTLDMVRTSSTFGWGVGNFTYRYVVTNPPMMVNYPQLQPIAGLYTNAAHNELLQTWAETGVIGMLALVALVVAAFKFYGSGALGLRRLDGAARIAGLAMLLAFCIQAQMNFPLQMPVGQLFFWLLIALPVVLPSRALAARAGLALPPLILDYSLLRLRVDLKTMRSPVGVGLQLKSGKVVAGLGIVLALAALGWGIALQSRPFLSDQYYKLAHEARLSRLWSAAEVYYLKALQLNPENVDCRSEYTQYLVDLGLWEDAIPQGLKTTERLGAYEVYERIAKGYYYTGNLEKWREAISEYARRKPKGIMYRELMANPPPKEEDQPAYIPPPLESVAP